MNLERKAKWAERVGVGVAKQLALVQADIWAKRNEAGDIYELDPLLVEKPICTRTAFSTLVDELAHQGHFLARHNRGLRCKVCNLYRAYRQFKFWSSHPCVPQPSAAAVISLFQNKKRHFTAGNSRHVCTSLGYRDILCTHSQSLPVSPERSSIPQTLRNVVINLILKLQSSMVKAISFRRNGMVMTWWVRRRRIDSYVDTGRPRVPIRSNFDDPEAFFEEEGSKQDVVQHMVPVSERPIVMCGTLGCSGFFSLSAVEYEYEAGKKPATCQTCGKFFQGCRPLIKCGKSGCTGSCLRSVVEYGYKAGRKPVTCSTCGKTFPRPKVALADFSPVKSGKKKGNNSQNASPGTPQRSRNTSPAMSRRSSVVPRSDSQRDQAVPKRVDAVMEDCTKSHQAGMNKMNMPDEHKQLIYGNSLKAEMQSLDDEKVVSTTMPTATSSYLGSGGFCGKHTFSAYLAGSRTDVGTQQRVAILELGSARPASRKLLSLMDLRWPRLVKPVKKQLCLHIAQDLGEGTQFAHVGYSRVDFAVEAVVLHGVDMAMSGVSCGISTSETRIRRIVSQTALYKA